MNNLNFASRNYQLAARITALLLAASLVLALAAIGMAWSAVSLRAGVSGIQKKLDDAVKADDQVKSVLAERDRLIKDLGDMSGVLEARRFSWTKFLSGLETVVPIGVAVTKVDVDPKGRSVSLEGTAQSPEALRNLVVALEKSNSFREPYLKHQSLEKGSISFNVVAVYHERQNPASVDHGKR